MNNSLVCLEGSVYFDEEVNAHTINIVAFRSGQQITVNRDRLNAGCTFYEHISRQLNNAEKSFNQFNLVKMEEVNDGSLFTDTIHIIYNFIATPGSEKSLWQVTYACLISNDEIMNFTSIYPDENIMMNESGRLLHCAKKFALNNNRA